MTRAYLLNSTVQILMQEIMIQPVGARWSKMKEPFFNENLIAVLRGYPVSEVGGIKAISPHSSMTNVIWCREREGFQASYSKQEAPLSVHCVFRGMQSFSIGNSPKVLLDRSGYLILNDGQSYEHVAEGMPEFESLTILFSSKCAVEMLATQFGVGDVLQFDSSSRNKLPIQVCERLRENDNIVTPRLLRIRSLLAESADFRMIAKELGVLLQRILHVHRDDVFAAEALPYQRSNTKFQMYERLHRAKNYISSSLEERWTLQSMAETVGFSPYHFRRCFNQMFGETPHQYLTNCRLKKASMMLRASEKSVTQICSEVGFESLGSFSTLFCHRYGLSPVRFRNTVSDLSIGPER